MSLSQYWVVYLTIKSVTRGYRFNVYPPNYGVEYQFSGKIKPFSENSLSGFLWTPEVKVLQLKNRHNMMYDYEEPNLFSFRSYASQTKEEEIYVLGIFISQIKLICANYFSNLTTFKKSSMILHTSREPVVCRHQNFDSIRKAYCYMLRVPETTSLQSTCSPFSRGILTIMARLRLFR